MIIFPIIWKSDEKPSTSQLGKHIAMFSDVSKAHGSASVCGPFFFAYPQIYAKRSMFIKMLVAEFSRSTIQHRIIEFSKLVEQLLLNQPGRRSWNLLSSL